jgi:ABC-type sugar transport system ATPase subunit
MSSTAADPNGSQSTSVGATPGGVSDGPALEVEHLCKSYGSVKALRDASLRVERGEVLGLIGDNGAGKSTLVKCVSGRTRPDGGTIRIGGSPFAEHSTIAAHDMGLEVVYQHLALVNTLDVASNLFLGREIVAGGGLLARIGWLRQREMRRESTRVLKEIGATLGSVAEPIDELSGGQRQAVAVGRVVVWGRKIVLMDEPAAALGVEQAARVIDLIRRLRERGVGVVFISHNMQQVLEVCDRVVVMRQGRTIGSAQAADVTAPDLVGFITGVQQPPA